jgi:hypothetical protein
MKTNILLFIACFSIICLEGLAQNNTSPSQTQAVGLENDLKKLLPEGGFRTGATNILRTFGNGSKGFEGTPYVFDEWYPTDIILSDGYKFERIFTKLDIYQEQDVLVLDKSKGDSIAVEDKQIISLVIDNNQTGKKHIFKKFQVGSGKSPRFCEVIYEGKYTLIVYQMKSILKADIGNSQSSGRYYDKFVSNIEFYIVTPDNQILKIKKSKKGLLNILNQYEKEFEEYLDKNKVDFDDRKTLESALAFYNSLLK